MIDTLLNGLEIVYELSEYGIHLAVVAGFAAAVLSVMVLTINLLVRRWLTAGQMSFLWGLVLLRMVMPIAPGSDFSVHNLLIYVDDASVATQPLQATNADVYQSVDSAKIEFVAPALDRTKSQVHAIDAAPIVEDLWLDILLMLLPFVWLAGAGFVVLMTFITHWRFSRKVSRTPQCENGHLLALWQRCREEVGISRELPLILFDGVSQPAVLGVLRPKLLLPSHSTELSDDQLRMVMLHELMHIKRYDVAVNWLLIFVRATQWWNPCYWLASSRFINLREQSRDAMVLQYIAANTDDSTQATRTYSELLLTLADRGVNKGWRVMVPASLLGFVSGYFRKRAVANRLKAMPRATQNQRRWHAYAVAVLLLGIGLIGLTDAASPGTGSLEPEYSDLWNIVANGETNSLTLIPPGTVFENSSYREQMAGEWTEHDYDVTEGIHRIAKQQDITLEEVLRLAQSEFDLFADPIAATGQREANGLSDDQVFRVPKATAERFEDTYKVHVHGPLATHYRIERAVHAMNRSGLGQVAIETRFASTQINVLEHVGLSWDGILASPLSEHQGSKADATTLISPDPPEASHPKVSTVASVQEHVPMMLKVLTDDQTRQFMQFSQGDARSSIMFAPKVTLFNGQQAQLMSGVQRPFVTGLKQAEDGTIEPRIDIVKEGFNLTLAAELTADHAAADLIADLDLSHVKEVQTFSTKMLGKEVAVQVPRVSHLRMNTKVSLLDGQTLLICIPPTYEQKHYSWILLTPRVIEEEIGE